jgi:hypothetical protein
VEIADHPRFYWFSGAIWAAVSQGPWQFSVRPEFYNDSDGVISGEKQNIWAVTASISYNILPDNAFHDLISKQEYRYDRSTGPEGGFYKGSDNHLTPIQNTLFLSLVWRLRSQ